MLVFSSSIIHLYYLAFTPRTDDTIECGKRKSCRTKEKLSYIEDNHRRTVTLSRRKSTMFNNAFKLNVMTGANVFLLIETPRKRLAWGSDTFMSQYKNGTLKSVVNQEIVDPLKISETSLGKDIEGVQPLDNTPDKVEVNSGLATVLGVDNRNITHVTPCNSDKGKLHPRGLDFVGKSGNVPEPVVELLMNTPTPQIWEEEIPQQYEQTYVAVTFIDENQIINVVAT